MNISVDSMHKWTCVDILLEVSVDEMILPFYVLSVAFLEDF